MTMTDLGEIIATLEQNQRDRPRDTELSDRVKLRLDDVRSLLQVDGGNGSSLATAANGSADPVYEEIRQSLDRVRQIARNLREGATDPSVTAAGPGVSRSRSISAFRFSTWPATVATVPVSSSSPALASSANRTPATSNGKLPLAVR